MLFFLLIAACVAEEVTLGFGADVAGSITVKLDPTVVDKCIATKYINFKITKEDEKYYGALYKDNECKTVIKDLEKIKLTVFTQAVRLPDFQEGITINLGAEATGAVTVAYPFGCLLSMIPGIDAALNGNANLGINNFAFVHTQFGVSVHSYTEGKCEGQDTIKEILTKASEQVKNAVNGIKVSIGEALEPLPSRDDLFIGVQETINNIKHHSKNMLQKMSQEIYSKLDDLPTIANDIIYEFNGTVMKVYEKVGEQFVYVQDAIKNTSEKIINILKEGDIETLITGDCDGGFQFAWNGETFQQLQLNANGECNINVNNDLFSLNLRANVTANSNGAKFTLNGKEYTIDKSKVQNKLKEAKTAIVETFGSLSEYKLNECRVIALADIFSTFPDAIIQHLSGNKMTKGIADILSGAKEITDELMNMLKTIGIPIPNFSYMMKPLEMKLGEETKYFATFDFYLTEDCTGNNLFDLIVGVIDEEKIGKTLEHAYQLIKHMNKEKCNENKSNEGFSKDYIDADVCINGYMYVFEDEALTFQKCTGDNTKQAQLKQETIVFPCGTCVECMKEQGIISSKDYAYVECGASSIFTILLVLLFFVLF